MTPLNTTGEVKYFKCRAWCAGTDCDNAPLSPQILTPLELRSFDTLLHAIQINPTLSDGIEMIKSNAPVCFCNRESCGEESPFQNASEIAPQRVDIDRLRSAGAIRDANLPCELTQFQCYKKNCIDNEEVMQWKCIELSIKNISFRYAMVRSIVRTAAMRRTASKMIAPPLFLIPLLTTPMFAKL